MGDHSLRSPINAVGTASSQAERVAPVPALTGDAVDQLQLDQPDRDDCEKNATSDAAACGTGGYIFDARLGCCNLGVGRTAGKWKKGTSIKCCGACAQ